MFCTFQIIFRDKIFFISMQDKNGSPKPTAPLTMEIDPHLRQLQEQAKLFSRYNSAPGTEPETKSPEKEPRKLILYIL